MCCLPNINFGRKIILIASRLYFDYTLILQSITTRKQNLNDFGPYTPNLFSVLMSVIPDNDIPLYCKKLKYITILYACHVLKLPL